MAGDILGLRLLEVKFRVRCGVAKVFGWRLLLTVCVDCGGELYKVRP